MTEAILSQLHNREKTIFWSLIGAFFLFAGLYVYFINTTIHNVVAKQNLETEASQLNLAIGRQEFQYIQMRNNVTLGLAYSLGFEDVQNKTFISKKLSAPQVSYLPR
jgi:hypothetical protein